MQIHDQEIKEIKERDVDKILVFHFINQTASECNWDIIHHG